MIVTDEMRTAYRTSLRSHIEYFTEAAGMIGVDVDLIAHHDDSKWSEDEFDAYAMQFFGAGMDPIGFAHAWLHHIHHNPHHWQHWIFPDKYNLKGAGLVDGIMMMPHRYVKEMVADWLGSSKAYTGSWDMRDWLNKNLPKIKLHPQTWIDLENTLCGLGYHVNFDLFANRFEVIHHDFDLR